MASQPSRPGRRLLTTELAPGLIAIAASATTARVLSVADELEMEVTELLDRWRRQYSARPDLEFRSLLLLALEREQIVAVAYREDVIAPIVNELPVDADMHRLIRQCLVWVWKDEEMHATYLRGLLLRTHRPIPALIVFGHQVVGALSGWVSSPRHHRTSAGLAIGGLTADVLVTVARLTGRISPALAGELSYRSFRRYCELNVVLERTAELAYGRLVELVAGKDERTLFEQIRDDERRHGEAFRVLADAFDDRDRAAVAAPELAQRLGRISPWFLPASVRDEQHTRRSSFRTGGLVFVGEGRDHNDLAKVIRHGLDQAGVGAMVRERGGRIAVRTSFMLGYDRRDRSMVASPAIMDELAAYLGDNGAVDVAVIEAPTVYGRYFDHRSVEEVAMYFGFRSPRYRVVDASTDQCPFPYQRGLVQSTISKTWWDADVRLVMAKLRTDPNEFGHLCLCSLEGMASQIDATIYTDRQLDFRTATMMLLDVAPPDAAIVDAWGPIADGPLGVMGCRRPATAWRMYVGGDTLSVDSAVLADMGLTDVRRSPIIRRTLHWFGADPAAPDVRGGVGPLGPGFRNPWSRRRWRALSRLSYPVYSYLSGHGSVFVPAIDEQAFPPKVPVGLPLRLTRWITQIMFGIRPERQ